MAIWGLALAVALCLESVSAASLGTVPTKGGKVSGYNKKVSGRYLDIFKGIPFAAPPGRFEKPKPHPGWEDVLEAIHPSKPCLQIKVNKLLQIKTMGSEDCLYLNIWVPQDPQSENVSTNLAVMVWLYGGAFMSGNALGPERPQYDGYLYDGEQIASMGNVIVVSVNYRVGTLGFLSTGDDGLPGNYGLWDQHTAIDWVYNNIHAFGGDPNKITIFGQSAGGASVNFQLLSPMNKDRIRRGISQSGVAFSPWAINRNPKDFAMQVAKKVGCPTDSTMADCLKKSDPVELTLAGKIQIHDLPSASFPIATHLDLSPVIDGDFLPDDPCNLSSNAADIDYMAGTNEIDGLFLAKVDVPRVNTVLPFTSDKKLRKLLKALTKGSGPEAAELAYQEYTHNWGHVKKVKRAIVEAETDFFFLVPTQVALQQHSSVPPSVGTGRTYSYLFSEKVSQWDSWKKGADHGHELPYVFGKPFTDSDSQTKKGHDQKLSEYMIAYWTNFAKTGDPNKGEFEVPVQWPEFNSETRKYVEINHGMGPGSVKQNLRQRFVDFWKETYPHHCSQITD